MMWKVKESKYKGIGAMEMIEYFIVNLSDNRVGKLSFDSFRKANAVTIAHNETIAKLETEFKDVDKLHSDVMIFLRTLIPKDKRVGSKITNLVAEKIASLEARVAELEKRIVNLRDNARVSYAELEGERDEWKYGFRVLHEQDATIDVMTYLLGEEPVMYAKLDYLIKTIDIEDTTAPDVQPLDTE